MPISQQIVNSDRPRHEIAPLQNVALAEFHFESAMNAAHLVGSQYSKLAKKQFVRECLDHLQASLAFSSGGGV